MTKRRGIAVLEIAVAILLMGLLLAVCVKTLAWSVRERRAVDRRAVALIEANNLMDQVTRMTWEELNDDSLKAITLSAEAQSWLPHAKLELSLQTNEDKLNSKRVSVKIDWPGSHGEREGAVLLNTWKFQEAENNESP